MTNVVVRSVVLLALSTAIVLVSAFVLPPRMPADTPVVAGQDGMAGHEMSAMATPVESEADFIVNMIPHHKEAVESARSVLRTSERTEVRDLAENVIAAQTKEIATLEGWLSRWYPDAEAAPYTSMMGDPSRLSPDEADMMFLEGMIGHHQGAIDMAQAYLDAGFAKQPEVTRLAEAIVSVQDREISQMRGWLEAWYGASKMPEMKH